MPDTLLSDRALLRLSGDDARGFMQGLVTNDVTGELPVWAALLSAQGKVLFDFFIWDESPHNAGESPRNADGSPGKDGADLLIDCEAAVADALLRRLTIYRLRRAIVMTREEVMGVHWAPDGTDDAGGTGVDGTGIDDTGGAGGEGAADPRLAALGRRWIGAVAGGDASTAYRAHRLALGVTEGAAELGSDQTLWLECNAAELNGVSFTKGCYVGQENTARMNWRSTVNRRLVVVPLADADPKRQRVADAVLGLSVEHRRVEDVPDGAWQEWMGAR